MKKKKREKSVRDFRDEAIGEICRDFEEFKSRGIGEQSAAILTASLHIGEGLVPLNVLFDIETSITGHLKKQRD